MKREKANVHYAFISPFIASLKKDVTFHIRKEGGVSSLPLFGGGGG